MADELATLRSENEELRKLVLEMDQALRNNPAPSHDSPLPQGDMEQLLEEKSEVIRGLHTENQELKKIIADLEERLYGGVTTEPVSTGNQPESTASTEQEIIELQEKRDQLRKEISELEKYICDEEVRTSRERAEIARQRYEVERLKADLDIELEKLQKDKDLKSKIIVMKSHLSGTHVALERPKQEESAKDSEFPPNAKANTPGFFAKLFGKK